MLTLSHQDITIGKKRIQISCTLKGMSGKRTYETGDHLQAELKVTPYGHLIMEGIQAKLEFIVQNQYDSTEISAGEVIVSDKVKLSSLKPSVFSFTLPKSFSRANQLSVYPKTFWRLTFSFITPPSIKSAAVHDKPSANIFTGTFKIPVALGKGYYFAKPRELPVERFASEEIIGLIMMSNVVLALSLFVTNDFSSFLSFLLVAFSLPLIILLLIKLSRFRGTPMQLVNNNHQKIKFRTLDRGEKSFRKATVGYRVVTEDYDIHSNSRKYTRHTFYKKELHLAGNAKRSGHFIDLTLPWPDEELPNSFRLGQYGYTWEFFIKTPGILREIEQAWPVQVGWKPFQLPEEITPMTTEESSSKEMLELRPLKEEVHQKSG